MKRFTKIEGQVMMIEEFDNNGNLIYKEDASKYWEKYEYDKNGNCIYYEDSNGLFKKCEYNNERRIIKEETNFCTKIYEYED